MPEAEQCGWLKDKYGLSWQIVPAAMDKMMKDKNGQRLARVAEAFLKIKKFDIKTLERAYADQGTQEVRESPVLCEVSGVLSGKHDAAQLRAGNRKHLAERYR